MLAKMIVKKYGKALLGQNIITPAVGAYPGGKATIVEVWPDPGAREIVMNVKHPTWVDEDDGSSIMGIFDYEDCELVGASDAQA